MLPAESNPGLPRYNIADRAFFRVFFRGWEKYLPIYENPETLSKHITDNPLLVIHPGFSQYWPTIDVNRNPAIQAEYEEYLANLKTKIGDTLEEGRSVIVFTPRKYLEETLGVIGSPDRIMLVPTRNDGTINADVILPEPNGKSFYQLLSQHISQAEVCGECGFNDFRSLAETLTKKVKLSLVDGCIFPEASQKIANRILSENPNRNANYLLEVNAVLGRLDIRDEIKAYKNSKDLAFSYLHNRWSRLLCLPVIQKAATPVLKANIKQDEAGVVLEVGSGTGIFEELLAPDWLKSRLISLDINRSALEMAQGKSDIVVFQGNLYQMGVANESADAIITYNGMDSNLALWEALGESGRCLKKGGRLVILQDLAPALFACLGISEGGQADSENYFDYLLAGISNLPELRLVESGVVEAVGVEKRSNIETRLKRFKENFGPAMPYLDMLIKGFSANDIGILLNNGPDLMIGRRLGYRWRGVLKEKLKEINVSSTSYNQLSKIKKRRNEVVEWTRMGYLVAEKN